MHKNVLVAMLQYIFTLKMNNLFRLMTELKEIFCLARSKRVKNFRPLSV